MLVQKSFENHSCIIYYLFALFHIQSDIHVYLALIYIHTSYQMLGWVLWLLVAVEFIVDEYLVFSGVSRCSNVCGFLG